jgi:type II secretory pathway pseudopilin PulG
MTLVEVVISTLVVGLLFVAALRAVSSSQITQTRTSDRSRGHQLAMDLMAEILTQAYADSDAVPLFGLESGESSTTRAAFDDVDDYHNWTACPPQDKGGTDLAEFAGWARTVQVEWARPADLSQTSTAATGVKRITVTVTRAGRPVAIIVAYRTNAWKTSIPDPGGVTDNHPPTASAKASASWIFAGGSVAFSATDSSDPDGDALSYAWNLGDGTTSNAASVTHYYGYSGTYTITLTVSDGCGGIDVTSLTVKVW